MIEFLIMYKLSFIYFSSVSINLRRMLENYSNIRNIY